MNKKIKKQIKKNLKKTNPVIAICSLVFLCIGVACGYFGMSYFTRNDCFELVGEGKVNVNLNGKYDEEGVKIIAFSKDISNKVEIDDSKVDYSTKGEYPIVYKVSNLKYKNVIRVRYVVVGDE